MSNMSQEDIDRMLRAAMEEGGTEQEETVPGLASDDFSAKMEELGEIGQRLADAQGNMLQTALQKPVTMVIANAALQTVTDALNEPQAPMLLTEGTFAQGINGGVLMLIKEEDAANLSDLLESDVTGGGLSDATYAALTRVMHQVFGAQDAVLSEILRAQVQTVWGDITPVTPESAGMLSWAGETEPLAALDFDVTINNAMQVKLVQMIPKKTMDTLVDALRGAGGAETAATGEDTASGGGYRSEEDGMEGVSAEEGQSAPKIKQGMGEIRSMKAREQQPLKRDQKGVQSMRYQTFDKRKDTSYNRSMPDNIGMIIDMPLQVTVELGKVRMSIKEILAFNLGSIIELDRMANDLVDVKVNGKLIARGEIVVVDENYGVRITDIVSPDRRVNSY